ncbi:hypothetical protein [Bacillus sp. V59.32b]|uniref:hypothetical protein n=1 Tax=Bacillus sp. V59.32b TaxID=1758642 RepID=UPI000E3C6198|nr:hypothetical protein [Bacillus sp. V59.32b]RFU60379.1 hypothetical protein D0463_17130 [Bacillus sp. V59.32b]
MMWFLAVIAAIVLFAFLMDRKRKKNNNTHLTSIDPHNKQGDSQPGPMNDNFGPGGS